MEKRVLIARWLRSHSPIPIYDEASVSSARQRVREAGTAANLASDLIERVVLIASELTHNHLVHARQGYLGVNAIERDGVKGLEVVAADLGPGLGKRILTGAGSVASSSGLGAGLEGVFRLADEVEIDTRGLEGMCVVARKFQSPVASTPEIAIAGTPYPGEIISGDDSVCISSASGFVAAVCDGLGHGPEARDASNQAVEAVMNNSEGHLEDMLFAVSAALHRKRGCAMGMVRFNKTTRSLECILAGDVRAHIYHVRDSHHFTATPFIVGDAEISKRRLRVEEISAVPGSVFIMFTDGLETRTTLKGQLDILRQPAIAIAQHLIDTHSRGTDDALALVAKLK